MALSMKEVLPGLFLYQCEPCGFESPTKPVERHNLGTPPPHICPKLNKGSEEILFDESDK